VFAGGSGARWLAFDTALSSIALPGARAAARRGVAMATPFLPFVEIAAFSTFFFASVSAPSAATGALLRPP
jgi:hypothetical protein